ncbi:unnamed protein product [Allacma fusca]|uniref:Uncharacterized protein n=1 Tax=Allacma fusca TaxID=39272 RepID=A0A8J2MDZ5_9HEXA|nr:unnamed protein product [Allacma fusca]
MAHHLTNGFMESDLTLIDALISDMESRLHLKYNETLVNLEEKLAIARSTNDRLEKNVNMLNVEMTRLCGHFGVEPPKSFEQFVVESSGRAEVAPPKISVEETPGVMTGGGSVVVIDSDIGRGDMVDGVITSAPVATSLLTSFGNQKVMFKCISVESEGKGLNDARGRFFSGVYKFDNGKEVLPVRITFIRYQDEDEMTQTPSYIYDFFVCFPTKQPVNSKDYYGNCEMSIVFLNADNDAVYSKTVSIKAGSGTCNHSGESAKDHASCEDVTAIIEDFFGCFTEKQRQNMFERDSVLRKLFPENRTQCFYFKTEVELFASSDYNQREVEIDSTAEPSDLEIIAYELEDLSNEAQIALKEWMCYPDESNLWFNDMEINIELIIFSQDKGHNKLKEQCIKNIMAVPKTVFESGCVDVETIKCLAHDYNLTELLNWVVSQE